MRRFLIPLLVAAALPAAAAPLGPASFEALSEGHTLRFATRDGALFGSEQYFPGRRSLWQYPDGSCAEGHWWPEGNDICFSYGPGSERECWSFESGPNGIAVRLIESSDGGRAGQLVIDLAGIDQTPLDCPAPDVGT